MCGEGDDGIVSDGEDAVAGGWANDLGAGEGAEGGECKEAWRLDEGGEPG